MKPLKHALRSPGSGSFQYHLDQQTRISYHEQLKISNAVRRYLAVSNESLFYRLDRSFRDALARGR